MKSNGLGSESFWRAIADSPLNASNIASLENSFLPDFGDAFL
jgi:hypothetical protein